MGAHAAKLVNPGKRADRRMIFNDNMARERSRVRHDDVVTENAVVADVGICHQKIVIADASVSAATFRSPVNVYVLSKNIVLADGEKGFFAPVLQILGL